MSLAEEFRHSWLHGIPCGLAVAALPPVERESSIEPFAPVHVSGQGARDDTGVQKLSVPALRLGHWAAFLAVLHRVRPTQQYRPRMPEHGTGPGGGLDLLELTEYAWHDCYGEITPPDEVILDILTCSEGNLVTMIQAAKLAVVDWRDLHLWAERVQAKGTQP